MYLAWIWVDELLGIYKIPMRASISMCNQMVTSEIRK